MSENSDARRGGTRVDSPRAEWHVDGNATRSEQESLSMRVVEALAEAKGVSPLDLDRPLYETIDPEALDNLFGPDADATGHVAFVVDGFEVTVTANREVYVRRQP